MSSHTLTVRFKKLGGWHFALDAGVLLVLLGLGVLGFGPAYGGAPAFLVAGLGGVVLGLAVAGASVLWRLGLISTVGLSALVYLLFGSAMAAPRESTAGFVPTFDSLRGLVLGVMFSWKEMLTLAAPVGTSVNVLVVPYLSALVCAIVAGTIAWRTRVPYAAVLPVLALFLTSIVFGTAQPLVPVVRGVLLVAVGVCWLAYRRERARTTGSTSVSAHGPQVDQSAARASLLRRLALGAVVVLLAGGASAAAAPLLTQADNRQVLRDAIVPPPDLHNLPTPLADFRKDVKDYKDTVLMSVTGLPKDGRVRLAALDDYDGVVYRVDENSSGSFSPVGDATALNTQLSGSAGSTVNFAIKAYSGVWIPSEHQASGIVYSAADKATHRLYLNKDSDTSLNMDGVTAGDSYDVAVSVPTFDKAKLATASFGNVTLPTLRNVPPIVQTKATEFVGKAETPLAKVQALANTLQQTGKFSNGLEGQVPSISGHGAARISSFLGAKQLVGDDEQYAVAMALMARQLDIPARVVMGFYPDPKTPANGASTVNITGADVHAWVEVNFAGVGWVPFDATPDKDHKPSPPEPQDASKPKPQVLQPPPPAQEPADLPPDSDPQALDTEGKKNNPWAFWGPILVVLAWVAVPLAILLLPLLLIALLKTRRRKRRFATGDTSKRVGGGWSEVISLATDMGAELDHRRTRRETAATLAEAFSERSDTTLLLATRADAAVFGAANPSEAEVSDYWKNVDYSLDGMNSSVGFWKRQRARFSPRSLLREANAKFGNDLPSALRTRWRRKNEH